MRLRLITREQETFENAFAAQIADFRLTHPDTEIEVHTLPIHDHFTKMITQQGCLTDEYDLFLCCTDWLPEVISRGELTGLNSFIEAKPPHGWPEAWHPAMRGLQTVNGQVYGLPWHDGPEVFHYRADLFEDETEKENFLIQLWSRGGVLLDEAGQPQFDSEIGIEALQFYVDLFHKHKVVSPECLNLGSVESGDYYAQGNAAMMWNWCGFAAVCEMPEYSKIVGQNRCTILPAGIKSVSLNIYWVLTIPVGSQHPDEAYAFLQHISQAHTDKMTSMAGANGVRLSTWQDAEVRAKYPYYNIIESVHANTLTLPTIPAYPEINEAISRAIHRALHQEMGVAESLGFAANEVREILACS